MKNLRPGNKTLARRISALRTELVGEGQSGMESMAYRMSLPSRTWANYEAGVTMPAEIMIQFIVATGADPRWLMTGIGARRYIRRP